MARVFVPKETRAGETRVATVPETVKKLINLGFEISVEAGAGVGAHIPDEAFAAVGASIVEGEVPWFEADLVLKVSPPTVEEAARLKKRATLVSFVSPNRNLDVVRKLAEGEISTLAMELIPRITRAQSMDALSSQASLAGYKAVTLAANKLGKYFPLLMTAAGTIAPARVVIMGAGVAGLQAIATAKRLGAIVEVSDIRDAVKQEVESLGGRFIELPMKETGEGEGGYAREMGEDFLEKQREIVTRHVASADVVITTAQIPGKKAPILLTTAMVEKMRPGAVVVDMAVESGGNCEQSVADEEVITDHGVMILGVSNLPATAPEDASLLYSRNILTLLNHLVTEGSLQFDLDDEITRGTLLTHEGKVTHKPTEELLDKGAA